MRYNTRYRSTGYLSSYFPPGVKWLLIINTALFLLFFLAVRTDFGQFFRLFGLVPRAVIQHFAIWQLVTYMFLHDPFSFGHILFNMLTLWMFGMDLERTWGTKRFLTYYFVCGIGAGICDVTANLFFGNLNTWTIGASGAIYGLLLAFALLFPDREILFFFLFPLKAKYFVMIIGAIAFLSSLGGSTSGVSHVAHLGGMLFGYAYLKFNVAGVSLPSGAGLRRGYERWKLDRARRKFQVYMKKRGDQDRWVQ